jgi:hypothetical protein
MDSNVTGCLRFKGTDSLMKRDLKTFNAITLSGAERRADGLFHITLTDHLREMRRLNQECGPNVQHPPPGAPSHPTIAVMPDTPSPPPATGPTPPPPPPGPPPGVVPPGDARPPGPEGEVMSPPVQGSGAAEGAAAGAGGEGPKPGEVRYLR